MKLLLCLYLLWLALTYAISSRDQGQANGWRLFYWTAAPLLVWAAIKVGTKL